MQVSVESMDGLERKVTVQMPVARIDNEVASRLHDLMKTARVEGYPPGQAPLAVVQQKYHKQVRQKVMEDVVRSTLTEILTQRNLKPAGAPKVSTKQIRHAQALEYSATFEVYPDIELQSLTGKRVEKPVVQVEEDDVESMFEQLRAQRASWISVLRASKIGDQIIVDYEGTIDGEGFSGGQADATAIFLGSGAMIKGFEEQLIGARPGEHRTLHLKFPNDYFDKKIAGKDVVFEVDVQALKELSLPEINDDLAISFGVDAGLQKFREKIKLTMARELDQAVNNIIKKQVLDALVETNSIEVPKRLVAEEIARMKQAVNESNDEDSSDADLPNSLFEDQARRQVVINLLLQYIVNTQSLQVDSERAQQVLGRIADNYDEPEQVIKSYQSDPAQMQQIEQMVLEEQVIEFLLGQMEIKEIPKRFADIVNRL